jgi:hypothetical protein
MVYHIDSICTHLYDASTSDYMALNDRIIITELRRIWKETLTVQFKVLSHLPVGTERNH